MTPRRWLRTVAAGVLTAVSTVLTPAVVLAPAASALSPLDRWTSATATRLTMHDGQGWLTLRLDIRSPGYAGLRLRLPRALTGPSELRLPGVVLACRPGDGGQVYDDYLCGQNSRSEATTAIPVGSYSVAVSVTGTVPAEDARYTTGTVSLWDPFYVSPGYSTLDLFPVLDAATPGLDLDSTAETKVARLRSTVSPTGTPQVTATLSTEVVVVPGEHIERLEFDMTGVPWRITGTNAPSLGLQCYQVHPYANRIVRCRPAVGATTFPTGTYQLTTRLLADRDPTGVLDPEGDRTSVWMYAGDATGLHADSLDWRYGRPVATQPPSGSRAGPRAGSMDTPTPRS